MTVLERRIAVVAIRMPCCKQLTNRCASGGGALAKYGPVPGILGGKGLAFFGRWFLIYGVNKASVDHAVGSKSYDARINTLRQRLTN